MASERKQHCGARRVGSPRVLGGVGFLGGAVSPLSTRLGAWGSRCKLPGGVLGDNPQPPKVLVRVAGKLAIAVAKRYFRLRGFSIAGASAPVASVVPTPLFEKDKFGSMLRLFVHYNMASTPRFSLFGYGVNLVYTTSPATSMLSTNMSFFKPDAKYHYITLRDREQ